MLHKHDAHCAEDAQLRHSELAKSDLHHQPSELTRHTFIGEWDSEGVFFYQAFNDRIADWAVEHQCFGGPDFNPTRMTWIKPSFAWVLHRSGYGRKPGQNRVLKVKLLHE